MTSRIPRFATVIVVALVGCTTAAPTPGSATPTTDGGSTATPTSSPTAESSVGPSSAPPSPTPSETGPSLPGPEGNLTICTDDSNFYCGTLEVPVDHADPDGASLTLAYRFLPHSDQTQPVISTIFGLPGGPGFSAYEAAGGLVVETLRPRHDHVLVDPRGTGGSSAIDCHDLQDGWAGVEELRTAVRACADQLGDAADQYSSADIARDIDLVREHLGYDTIDVYGFSYGSVVAQAYAARFAERIRALVLDSGLVSTDPDWQWNFGYPQAWIEIAARFCAQGPACRDEHPDPEAELTAFFESVSQAPITGSVGSLDITLDAKAWFAILGSIGAFPESLSADRLLDAAAAHAAGDDRPALGLSRFYDPEVGDQGDPARYSQGLSNAQYCSDAPLAWDPDDPITEREQKLRAAIEGIPADHSNRSVWLP